MQSGGEKDNGTKTVTFTQREYQIGEHNANLTQSLAGNAQEQTNAQTIKFRIRSNVHRITGGRRVCCT